MSSWKYLVLCVSLAAACTPAPDARECASELDCEGYTDTPYCNPRTRRCAPPCTDDVVGELVCMDGVPSYCASGLALPCDVCPGACSGGTYCDAATGGCAPRKAPGEACAGNLECTTYCHEGVCGVQQGEECTDATCDGACLTGGGRTYCLRPCSGGCPSSAAGLEWTCIRYGWDTSAPAFCVPSEDCSDPGPCSSLDDATCGTACSASGPCSNFCSPRVFQDMRM